MVINDLLHYLLHNSRYKVTRTKQEFLNSIENNKALMQQINLKQKIIDARNSEMPAKRSMFVVTQATVPYFVLRKL